MTLFEVDEAANRIRDEVDPEANIIFGAVVDDTMVGRVKITVIATGFDGEGSTQIADGTVSAASETPVDLENYSAWRQERPSEQVVGDSFAISRRPLIELPLSPPDEQTDALQRATGDGSGVAEADEVPAFLRSRGD